MANKTLKSLPNASANYAKIIKSMLPVVGKKVSKSKPLPDATYSINKLKLGRSHLQDYRRICGFADTGQVPPTYFAVLSQAVQMQMMVDEAFPFAMLGLVHIENSVTQYRRIADTETVAMSVSFANLRDHDKGKQFDFDTKVHDSDGELIWEGTSTYLSRQKTSSTKSKKDSPNAGKPTAEADDLDHIFAVPADIGRRYGKVSGDFNPIHIHPLTAKALGFPTAIAHGMWSKAKCLSLMDLPEAYTASVSFKLPILLPAEVELIGDSHRAMLENGEATFNLYNAKNDKPHLAGEITVINDK